MSRRGYASALAVAVAVLLGSVGLAAAALVAPRFDRVVERGAWTYGDDGWGLGMMDPGDPGQLQVDPGAAQKIATDWLTATQPGAQLGGGVATPMGYVFPVTRAGTQVGTLVVHGGGQVSYRAFHDAAPTPSASSSR